MSLKTCGLADTDIRGYSLYIDDTKNSYLFPCCAWLLSTLDQGMEEVPETWTLYQGEAGRTQQLLDLMPFPE